MAIHCTACGTQLPDDARFCPRCGTQQATVSDKANQTASRLSRPAEAMASNDESPEEELWRGRFSGRSMVSKWLAALLITVGAPVAASLGRLLSSEWPILWLGIAVLWLLLIAQMAYRKIGALYILTNRRLHHRRGIFLQQTRRIEVIDIDDVTVKQSLLQRMVGAGTIEISSSDVSDPLLILPGIANAQVVSQQIDDARRRERLKRGIYVESV